MNGPDDDRGLESVTSERAYEHSQGTALPKSKALGGENVG